MPQKPKQNKGRSTLGEGVDNLADTAYGAYTLANSKRDVPGSYGYGTGNPDNDLKDLPIRAMAGAKLAGEYGLTAHKDPIAQSTMEDFTYGFNKGPSSVKSSPLPIESPHPAKRPDPI